jgi:hypothetical protein
MTREEYLEIREKKWQEVGETCPVRSFICTLLSFDLVLLE